MIKIATILTTLIIGLMAGPAVSLYGSPTVSPVTAAACAKEPLPPRFPSSINFFALSQAAPPDVIAIAMNNPVTIVPTSSPPSTTAPSGLMIATKTTATNGNNAGTIISRKAAFVTMSTQVPYSGLSCPVRMPGLACNLPAHLAHNSACGLAHRVHAEGSEDEWQESADEKSDDDFRIIERELKREHIAPPRDMPAQFFHVRPEQHQRRQSRRSDGITFGDSFHGIANRVEVICYGPNFLWQMGHHCDTASVVCDR